MLPVCAAFLLLLAGGCGYAQQAHFVRPDTSLASSERVYVIQNEADDWEIGAKIVDALASRGIRAGRGSRATVPADTHVVVTYEDHWMWDITMYMLSLKVDFRDAETDALVASGQSYRTSLYRKSPETMVEEVMAGVLPGGGGR
jgi:hypothetical protein